MAVWRNPRAQNFNESLSKRGPNFKNAIFTLIFFRESIMTCTFQKWMIGNLRMKTPLCINRPIEQEHFVTKLRLN